MEKFDAEKSISDLQDLVEKISFLETRLTSATERDEVDKTPKNEAQSDLLTVCEKPKPDLKKTYKADFSILDIRVGKIVSFERHPRANLNMVAVAKVDVGGGQYRYAYTIFSQWVPDYEMPGRMVLLICNLMRRNIAWTVIDSFFLTARKPGTLELLLPPENAAVGDRVTVNGFEGEPAPTNCDSDVKYAVLEDLRTSSSKVVTYKGIPLEIKGKGVVTAPSLVDAHIG